MKKFLFFFFCNIFFSYSQNNTLVSYEILKEKFTEEKVDLDKINLSSEIVNKTELSILDLLNNSKNEFENKEITFISGSAGTTISKKSSFFNSFKNYFIEKKIIQFSIIKLEEKEKSLSESDYLIFFWVKTMNPKSKKLLKKIKNTKYQK
jgi:hypothetical protein